MHITGAAPADIDEAIGCAVAAFGQDPITGFLLDPGPGYPQRLRQFFSLLMRARVALQMPVLVARDAGRIRGVAMGYATDCPPWPHAIAQEWDRFEASTAGLTERMAVYDEIAAKCKPLAPHYYLGVIAVDPASQGQGLGTQLLKSFCDVSASDPLSSGVYLETASPSNVRFYERSGFEETGRGSLRDATLWCMFLRHRGQGT